MANRGILRIAKRPLAEPSFGQCRSKIIQDSSSIPTWREPSDSEDWRRNLVCKGNGNSLSEEMPVPAGRRLSFKAADSLVGLLEGTRLSRQPRVGVFLSNCASTRPSYSQWESEWQPMDLPGRGAAEKEGWLAGNGMQPLFVSGVEPGDYVNVAHGGATDATRSPSSPPSLSSSSSHAYTLIPITSPAATLRGILFRSSEEIPYKFRQARGCELKGKRSDDPPRSRLNRNYHRRHRTDRTGGHERNDNRVTCRGLKGFNWSRHLPSYLPCPAVVRESDPVPGTTPSSHCQPGRAILRGTRGE